MVQVNSTGKIPSKTVRLASAVAYCFGPLGMARAFRKLESKLEENEEIRKEVSTYITK